MKIQVDRDVCAGIGFCIESCPEVFGFDEQHISTVKLDDIPAELEQACREAADNCLANAIAIEE